MLRINEETGWIALYIAIVHYKDVSVERAITAADSRTSFRLEKEVLTPLKVQVAMKPGKRGGVKNLESYLRLSALTIVKIRLLARLEGFTVGNKRIISQDKLQEIIKDLENGIPLYKLAAISHIAPQTLSRILRDVNRDDKDVCVKKKPRRDVDALLKHTLAVRAYWRTFSAGDSVAIKINGKGILQGVIANTNEAHMRVCLCHAKTIAIQFADLMMKQTSIIHSVETKQPLSATKV